MPNSTNLALPYIDANQNQKYVTHNTALRILDALVQIQVQSATLTAPPGSPSDGQVWIVASGATGAWLGKDLQLAAWQDGAWAFYAPRAGYIAFNVATSTALVWTGSVWISILAALSTLMLSALGIGTAADSGNPLSVTANNALFNALGTGSGGTGDMRIKLNKAAAANTASFLFQDAFSGRAEIGLAGDDNFHFKVSPNGTTFVDALAINSATGLVTASFGVAIAGGTIDGAVIGGTTSAAATFLTVTFNSANGTAGSINKVALFSTTYGLGVSAGSLDIVGNSVSIYSGASKVGSFTSTGLNATAIGTTTASTVRGTTVTATTSVNLPSYTVATLPAAGTAGRAVYCSNARMFNGAGILEGAGAGTGGLVTDSGSAWRIAGTNVTASA